MAIRIAARAGWLASLLLAGSAAASVPPPRPDPAWEAVATLVSPLRVAARGPLRVLAAGPGREFAGRTIALRSPSGADVEPLAVRAGGGPPWWTAATFRVPADGVYVVEVRQGRRVVASRPLEVPSRPAAAPAGRGVWTSRAGWTPDEERLYSAWIEALFQEADERSSWPTLHDAVRDPGRNLLFDHLGLGEDGSGGARMQPDCADSPYFLRAYYAWKRGLPFGSRRCDRGTLERCPRCGTVETQEALPAHGAPVRDFERFLALLKDRIHSGSGRTCLESEESDYYPLALERGALRPGAVYTDPYGHTLMLVRWVAQRDGAPGRLLSVDAQPDGTIGIKRFWKGNFLFAVDQVIGDPGWKAFRPLVLDGATARPLPSAALTAASGYAPASLRQKDLDPGEFYDAMARLVNPEPLDPVAALRDLFAALREQLLVRVDSVDNGTKYMAAHPGAVVPMPSGAALFQTTGPWEDFSTPNRDLRLLIAIDTVLGFPDEVARTPRAWRIPRGRTATEFRAELAKLRDRWAGETTIAYPRTDRSPWTLTLARVLERREAFEVGYNPNDGPEVRWGAPAGSEELATCRRRAPRAQVAKMEELRRWFRKRLHPPT